jgi:hypothetical protein
MRKSAASDVRDIKDRIAQSETRIKTDVERMTRADREDRASLGARLRECEELARSMDKKMASKYARMEDAVPRAWGTLQRETGGNGERRGDAQLEDLRVEMYEQRQQLHSSELSVELRVSAALDKLQAAHTQSTAAAAQARADTREMIAMAKAWMKAQESRLEQLEAAIRSQSTRIDDAARGRSMTDLHSATIVIHNAELPKDAPPIINYGDSIQLSFLQQAFRPALPSDDGTLQSDGIRIALESPQGSRVSPSDGTNTDIGQDSMQSDGYQGTRNESPDSAGSYPVGSSRASMS